MYEPKSGKLPARRPGLDECPMFVRESMGRKRRVQPLNATAMQAKKSAYCVPAGGVKNLSTLLLSTRDTPVSTKAGMGDIGSNS